MAGSKEAYSANVYNQQTKESLIRQGLKAGEIVGAGFVIYGLAIGSVMAVIGGLGALVAAREILVNRKGK